MCLSGVRLRQDIVCEEGESRDYVNNMADVVYYTPEMHISILGLKFETHRNHWRLKAFLPFELESYWENCASANKRQWFSRQYELGQIKYKH